MEKGDNKESYIEDYERPRCKVLLRLPFGLFIARYVRVKVEAGVACPTQTS